MRDSLRLLAKNEQPWANCSGRSPIMSESLVFLSKLLIRSLFSHFFQKTSDSLRKPMREFPTLPWQFSSWLSVPLVIQQLTSSHHDSSATDYQSLWQFNSWPAATMTVQQMAISPSGNSTADQQPLWQFSNWLSIVAKRLPKFQINQLAGWLCHAFVYHVIHV